MPKSAFGPKTWKNLNVQEILDGVSTAIDIGTMGAQLRRAGIGGCTVV